MVTSVSGEKSEKQMWPQGETETGSLSKVKTEQKS